MKKSAINPANLANGAQNQRKWALCAHLCANYGRKSWRKPWFLSWRRPLTNLIEKQWRRALGRLFLFSIRFSSVFLKEIRKLNLEINVWGFLAAFHGFTTKSPPNGDTCPSQPCTRAPPRSSPGTCGHDIMRGGTARICALSGPRGQTQGGHRRSVQPEMWWARQMGRAKPKKPAPIGRSVLVTSHIHVQLCQADLWFS